MHYQVHNLTELYRVQATLIPQGGDWRWLPNVDLVGEGGMVVGTKM
jgi:hypothetical protein